MENTKELNTEKQCDIHVVSRRRRMDGSTTICL